MHGAIELEAALGRRTVYRRQREALATLAILVSSGDKGGKCRRAALLRFALEFVRQHHHAAHGWAERSRQHRHAAVTRRGRSCCGSGGQLGGARLRGARQHFVVSRQHAPAQECGRVVALRAQQHAHQRAQLRRPRKDHTPLSPGAGGALDGLLERHVRRARDCQCRANAQRPRVSRQHRPAGGRAVMGTIDTARQRSALRAARVLPLWQPHARAPLQQGGGLGKVPGLALGKLDGCARSIAAWGS